MFLFKKFYFKIHETKSKQISILVYFNFRRFHTHLLHYDGQGRYRLCPIDSKNLLSPNSDMNKNEVCINP